MTEFKSETKMTKSMSLKMTISNLECLFIFCFKNKSFQFVKKRQDDSSQAAVDAKRCIRRWQNCPWILLTFCRWNALNDPTETVKRKKNTADGLKRKKFLSMLARPDRAGPRRYACGLGPFADLPCNPHDMWVLRLPALMLCWLALRSR